MVSDELKEKYERNLEEMRLDNRIRTAHKAIDAGDHLYYFVLDGTNVRYSIDGCPIIYTRWKDRETILRDEYVSMKVSDYNSIFGRFMTGCDSDG